MASNNSSTKIVSANILSAFADVTIGTKVLDREAFLAVVSTAIEGHDFAGDRVPGQGFISLPESAFALVSAGVGRRSANSEDYVLRANRGRVNAYLCRSKAAQVESLACIVYTRAAYLADPDVIDDTEEFDRITRSDVTHVLVAVLAAAGPKAPLTPIRFVENLAGGNKEALLWSADEIRQKAKGVADYDREWVVVAD